MLIWRYMVSGKANLPPSFWRRGVVKLIGCEELKRRKKRVQWRVKHGVDPTTGDLHLGHMVIYRRLRKLQEAGHRVIFLLGEFTARFGDPTGRSAPRQLRKPQEVRRQARRYLAQAGKIIDMQRAEVRSNSEWYSRMRAEMLLKLMARTSVARMLERDMFVQRQKKGQRIGLHELVYPLLQGWDSVMLEADLTVIGSDQIFNELVGRTLQQQEGQFPQAIVALEMLRGTDGEIISQSRGNGISLSCPPEEMFGRLMSLPDSLVPHYATLLTELPLRLFPRTLRGPRAREAKEKLAADIVAQVHGTAAARRAAAVFRHIFQQKKLPARIPQKRVRHGRWKVADLLLTLGLAPSKSEARRLHQQGGIYWQGNPLPPNKKEVVVRGGEILRVGKRRWCRLG
jgi:tyrosyl-tRNA synthetase